MDSLQHTPFLDLFRRGDVAPDVRLLAAQGALAPRAQEQLALLVLLTSDADPTIRETANRTIDRIPPDLLSAFLARPDVDEGIRGFFEKRGVVAAEVPAGDFDDPLVTAETLPGDGPAEGVAAQSMAEEPTAISSETTGESKGVTEGATAGGTEGVTEVDDPDAAMVAAARERIPTVQRLSLLNITERIKVAMRGNREERMVLIRDPNKLVALAVLASPKVTEQEIEGFARLAAVSEDVLRVIGTSRSWTKNYAVLSGLAFNPKTPIGISMGFVNRLTERDVRMLATDRNVPEPIKILARKFARAGQARKR